MKNAMVAIEKWLNHTHTQAMHIGRHWIQLHKAIKCETITTKTIKKSEKKYIYFCVKLKSIIAAVCIYIQCIDRHFMAWAGLVGWLPAWNHFGTLCARPHSYTQYQTKKQP